MKYLPLLLLFFCINSFAQNNTSTISLTGIDDIKLGMSNTELEKLIGQPVKITKLLHTEDWQRDTFDITYKNIPYKVIFEKDYFNEKSKGFIVYEIYSNSNALKTRSGIGIGDDKLKIVSTYGDYMLQIMPEYENETTKSKTRSTVWLYGDNGSVIIFYMTNNKVTGFSVMYNEGC